MTPWLDQFREFVRKHLHRIGWNELRYPAGTSLADLLCFAAPLPEAFERVAAMLLAVGASARKPVYPVLNNLRVEPGWRPNDWPAV
jgi:hypothetical protein